MLEENQSSLKAVIDELMTKLDGLYKTVHEMEKHLSPILLPEVSEQDTKEGAIQREPHHSQVFYAIHGSLVVVDQINQKVLTILKRLEL